MKTVVNTTKIDELWLITMKHRYIASTTLIEGNCPDKNESTIDKTEPKTEKIESTIHKTESKTDKTESTTDKTESTTGKEQIDDCKPIYEVQESSLNHAFTVEAHWRVLCHIFL